MTRKARWGYGVLCAAYIVYAAVFIWRTSFIIEGKRYFALLDDPMISMRYASNFANGYGMTWNRDEARTEGFTNLLWVLIMAFFHAMPIAARIQSLLIQSLGIACMLGVMWGVRYAVQQLTRDERTSFLAVCLTAFFFSLNYWTLQGMETGLLALLLIAAVGSALSGLRRRAFSLYPYVWLGIATWVRLDAVVMMGVLTAFLVWSDRDNRVKHVSMGCGVALLCIGTQTVWRYLYFGDLMPNTYYLKMSGYPVLLRIKRGFHVLLNMIGRTNPVMWGVPVFVLWRSFDKTGLLFMLLGGQMAYSAYVGGDAWEWDGNVNRFIVIAMPLFFILFALSCERMWSSCSNGFRGTFGNAPCFRWSLVVVLSALGWFSMNLLPYGGAVFAFKQYFLCESSDRTLFNRQAVLRARLLSARTTPSARVAVVKAGTLPYFLPRKCVDMFGKCDRHIARIPARRKAFYPGHMKWDYAYSIGALRPDIIAEL